MQAKAITHVTDTNDTTVANPDCRGAMYLVADTVYRGSGYTSVSFQDLREPGQNFDYLVKQAAVSFPSADLALAVVKNSVGKWRSCANQTIAETDSSGTTRWTMSSVTGDPPKITIVKTQEGGGGWACQRALSAVSNVVFDVTACSYHLNDQATQIVDKMASNVTQ